MSVEAVTKGVLIANRSTFNQSCAENVALAAEVHRPVTCGECGGTHYPEEAPRDSREESAAMLLLEQK